MRRYLKNCQPFAVKFIKKSSLFILLPGVIQWLELKPNSEQKAENIFDISAISSNRLLAASLALYTSIPPF